MPKKVREKIDISLHNTHLVASHHSPIYLINKQNTIHVTSPLYHLKLIFQSPITLHMNHTLDSRRNNTQQFHNKQFTGCLGVHNKIRHTMGMPGHSH